MKELLRKVKLLDIRVRRLVLSTFAGEYRTAFKGSGLEFEEVRPYQPGDDVRGIDWNVTAKTGTPFVKVFREERELTVFVLFDVSASEKFGPAGADKLQIGTEISAILAFSAQDNGDKFGLIAFTDHVELFAKPTKGRRQVLAIISRLLGRAPKSRGTHLRVALELFRRYQKRRSVLFVISDFLDKDYEKQLMLLQRRHEVNLIRLYHPEEPNLPNVGIAPVVDAERGAERWVLSASPAYRRALRTQFEQIDGRLDWLSRKYGIGYLPIDITQDYVPRLELFFRGKAGGGGRRRAA